MIKSTLGRTYTIDQFNQLKVMPDGVEFYDLKLTNESVTKLPKNLVVHNQLVLTNTQVTKLPSDLKTEVLVLSGSEVSSLPEGLTVRTLNLNQSKLKSIGENITVTNNLYLDSTEMLNHQIACVSCIISRIDSPGLFDLSQVVMDELIVEGREYDIEVKNARAKRCLLTASPVVIDNSTFEEIKLHDITNKRNSTPEHPARLRFQSGVCSDKLVIRESEAFIELEIDRATINTVRLHKQPYHNVKINELVLYGDLVVNSYVNITTPNLLPRLGVVYGDVYIPKNCEIPEFFSCVGTVHTI